MCYDEQMESESVGFYYEYDKETDRIHATPVLTSARCSRPTALSVWRHSRVHLCAAGVQRRSQQVRCAYTPPETTCCVTKPDKSKCCVKRRPTTMFPFMPKYSSSVVSPTESRFVVFEGGDSGFIINGGFNVSSHSHNKLICRVEARRHRRAEFCVGPSAPPSESDDICCHTPPSSSSNCSSPSSTFSAQHNLHSNASPSSSYAQPLTPASTNSSSPNSPLYWFVSHGEYVPEECDWREWIDEIVDEVRNEIHSETLFDEPKRKLSCESIRKRKLSQSSFESSSPSPSYSDLPPPSSSKRAKKYSLATLSHEEVAQRKKEQNRIAAQRYRSRKNQTLEEGRTEISYLELRNADLRVDIYALEQEIRQLKTQLVGR